MKKLILLLTLGLLTVSCTKKGEIGREPQDFIKIHNKTYKLMRVYPDDNEHGIWILYPKDSTDAQPEVINYEIPQGKTTVNQTVIKVD